MGFGSGSAWSVFGLGLVLLGWFCAWVWDGFFTTLTNFLSSAAFGSRFGSRLAALCLGLPAAFYDF